MVRWEPKIERETLVWKKNESCWQGVWIGSTSKLKNHNSNSSLISQNSISLKTQNGKFLFGSNISKLCPTSQYSTFSLYGGAHSLHRSEGQFSLARVLFSLLSPSVFCLLVTGPAEWWSKKCNRLRSQVKKRPPNFNQ